MHPYKFSSSRQIPLVLNILCAAQVRGPPTKAAFSADGPTKALEGFCKKNGVSPADLTKQTDAKGVEYVYARVKEEGRSAAEVRVCACVVCVRVPLGKNVTKQTDAKGVGFTCTLGLRKKGGQLLRCVFTQSVHAHAWIGFVCVKVCVWEEAVKQMQGFGMDPQGNEKR